jgi:hypothetical protein
MGKHESRLIWDEDERFDRLADGELSGEEREAFLALLESEEGGWRRCSLAFLEAQEFRRAIKSISDDLGGEPGLKNSVGREYSARSSTGRGKAVRLCAAAAALVGAFFLGFRSWSNVSMDSVPSPHLAQSDRTLPAGGEPLATDAPTLVADSPRIDREPTDPAVPGARFASWPPLDAVRQGAGDSPTVIPDYLRGLLQRQGYRLESESGMVPVSLGDGREYAVPVERVNVRYVGLRNY